MYQFGGRLAWISQHSNIQNHENFESSKTFTSIIQNKVNESKMG